MRYLENQRMLAEISQTISDGNIQEIASLNLEERNQLHKALLENRVEGDDVLISILIVSRKSGNPCNKLRSFLDSLLVKTSNLRNVEVLVRIDNDDDLYYYLNIKREFSAKISLSFVVGDRERGYRDLHKLAHHLISFLAEGSKAVLACSDDSLLCRQNWDVLVKEVIGSYPDNIFFINPSRGRTWELPYENLELFFHLLWEKGPPALFSIIGRSVIEIITEAVEGIDSWTCFGNSVLADSFFETLQMYLWTITKVKRGVNLQGIVDLQPELILPDHKQGKRWSHPIAVEAYKEFITLETQEVIRSIAGKIAERLTPIERGDVEENIPRFEKLTKLSPNDASVHNTLGQALYKAGQLQQAETAFLKALTLAPNSADVHNSLAVLYWESENTERAVEHMRQALELDPQNPDVVVNCVLMQEAVGETDEAIRQLEGYLAIHEDKALQQELERMRQEM